MNTDLNYLTVTEFAAHSRLSVATVRRYVRAGKLPSVQADKGHRILIPRDALDSLRQENAGNSEEGPPTQSGRKRRSTPRWNS